MKVMSLEIGKQKEFSICIEALAVGAGDVLLVSFMGRQCEGTKEPGDKIIL